MPTKIFLPRKAAPPALFRGSIPSKWDFWKHGVTSSFLYSYVTCREQTKLHYVDGWATRSVPLYFEFGTCCHWVLEQAYGLLAGDSYSPPGVDFVSAKIGLYHQQWLKSVSMPSQKQLDQQELVYGLAEAILPSYFERWSGDFTGTYKYPNQSITPAEWLNLEEVFDVPYTYPDGKTTHLRGRRDGVFADAKGNAWVFDTKCRSVINDEDTMDTFPLDLQQMFYLWVTASQFSSQKKRPPVGTLLNNIRRPGHRQGIHETLPDFLDRVRKDVSKPARFDHFFIRYQMRITMEEIRDWKVRFLDPIMAEVRGWWEGTIPHYCNPNSLVTKYGRAQMFLPITKDCFDYCYRKDNVFPELPEVK